MSCHGFEIPYAYHDVQGFPWTFPAADLALSDVMANFWGTFITTGSPNPSGGNWTWPTWTPGTMESMQFNVPVSIDKGLQNATCNFWDSIGYDMQEAVVDAPGRTTGLFERALAVAKRLNLV